VVDVVEPVQRIRSCPLGLKSHGVSLCPLHQRLDAAMESVEGLQVRAPRRCAAAARACRAKSASSRLWLADRSSRTPATHTRPAAEAQSLGAPIESTDAGWLASAL